MLLEKNANYRWSCKVVLNLLLLKTLQIREKEQKERKKQRSKKEVKGVHGKNEWQTLC